MTEEADSLGRVSEATISQTLQNAGVAGAGGAGFPSYVKWSALEDVNCLMMNHQESEPLYYADKWLAREHAEEFGEFLHLLLNEIFDLVVVGTKEKYRSRWTDRLEASTDATIYEPADLPFDTETASGTVFVYTPDVYTYSEEKILLMVTTGLQIGDDLPTEHGWIVHNTESLYNVLRAVRDGTPVTRKYVHVDGNTPRHRCLEVPVGMPATDLLRAAGRDRIEADEVLADGGPGWCYKIGRLPDEFGVRKRTNALLVLDADVVADNTDEDGRTNVLDIDEYDWADGDHETEPARISPELVRVPLITNAAYRGLVEPSHPVVSSGDEVSEGDVVAEPAPDGISNTQHASIDGIVSEVTDTHIVITRV